MRRAEQNCPACEFDMLLYATAGNIWCLSCGLLCPADMVYRADTGERVRF